MGRFFLVLLFLIGFGTLAYAQAVLRVGDPIELKIGGVPNEEQQQVNNILHCRLEWLRQSSLY